MGINVILIDMDTQINEQICHNQDDTYTIFINSRMNYETQVCSYCHAMNHILNKDFYKVDADDIERDAHS